MYKNRIYRQIAADCTKAYWSSILFYALQLIVSQVAVAYSARMLGVFSADILNNEMQKGLGCLWQILICVAISVTLPLVCSTLGELLMFRASLNHERAVLNRYLNKTYAAAVGLRGSDAQFRLEEDQIQLGGYWNTTGMYLISVPIVVTYLLWQMVPVMGWFTLFVAAVCCVRIFVPIFFRKKTEEYDRLERESRTKMRNLEQEMLEKPVELCLYGLQNDELARLKCLQKDYLETLFVKKAKLETWQKNILGGMDTATSGQIWVDGRNIAKYNNRQLTSYRRDDIGFVFQFYNLMQNLTALENVELAMQICKHPLDASEVLAEVGLEERMNNFPAQLSGGEQQRVAIARALAKNPKLLLCDEPTGALDYVTGKAILKLLQDTCREKGMTVIVITHNSALTPMADRVIKIRNGKVAGMKTNENPTPVEEIEW